MYTIGIDIGASKIMAALVEYGRIVGAKKIVLKRKTSADITRAVFNLIESVKNNKKISGIGIGMPCIFDKNERILVCPNIPALNPKNIVKAIAARYRIPLVIENDVKAAALAELHNGIGKRIKNFVFIAFGSGIGGAAIINGKLYKGAGWAGEFGHTIVGMPHKEWEHVASAQFLKTHKNKNARKLLAVDIGMGLLNVTYNFAPEAIVIGGGLLSLWNHSFQKNVTAAFKNMRVSKNMPVPKIIRTSFGENAGVIGAALLPVVAKR